jgi:ribosomal protein S18 acetylase RimI-like enzyme
MQDETERLRVRTAAQDDAALLVMLNREVQQLHASLAPQVFRPETDSMSVAAFFKSWIAKPGHSVLIAEHDGKACGYAWVEVQHQPGTPFSFPQRRMFVRHIAVLEAARRRGVATALFRQVEASAVAAEATELALDVWASNAAARDFFTAMGFTPHRLAMAKRVAG